MEAGSCSLLCGSMESFGAIMWAMESGRGKMEKPCARRAARLRLLKAPSVRRSSLRRHDPHQVQRVAREFLRGPLSREAPLQLMIARVGARAGESTAALGVVREARVHEAAEERVRVVRLAVELGVILAG